MDVARLSTESIWRCAEHGKTSRRLAGQEEAEDGLMLDISVLPRRPSNPLWVKYMACVPSITAIGIIMAAQVEAWLGVAALAFAALVVLWLLRRWERHLENDYQQVLYEWHNPVDPWNYPPVSLDGLTRPMPPPAPDDPPGYFASKK